MVSDAPIGLVSLDPGHELVTARIAEWLVRMADGDEYRASKLLESRLTWEAFTDRARVLFDRVENRRADSRHDLPYLVLSVTHTPTGAGINRYWPFESYTQPKHLKRRPRTRIALSVDPSNWERAETCGRR
jgi:hypothetical protein